MTTQQDIAIVGLGCIFPGAHDADQFWSLICRGDCVASQPPAGRWPDDPQFFCQKQLSADRLLSSRACFVDPLPSFTTPVIPGFDTSELDPLFHLLLHAGQQAWNDAITDTLDRRNCGVLLGQIVLPSETLSNWSDVLLARATEAVWGESSSGALSPFNPLNRYVAGLPAGLLAAALDLGGGASCLDAACASSLFAMKLAMDELREGRRDAMLVGGLSRPDSLYTQMGFSHLYALSPSGNCQPFSRNADGLLVGEGAGMVVLKRLEDALDSGDHIYATLPGIGLSNDIGGNLMHPDSEGQLRAMHKAYELAGWRPEQVDLIECHGTGTPTGDRVELASLQQLWSGAPSDLTKVCVIGSVKSNIGHLLTAAGIAGLIKVLLAMKARQLPPSANSKHLLPVLEADDSHFRMLAKVEPWPVRGEGIPRRAAVSAFGFGGVNAHVLVEEWSPMHAKSMHNTKVRQRKIGQVQQEPIAIVGLSGQFGPWTNPAALTSRLLGDTQAEQSLETGRSPGFSGEGMRRGYPLEVITIDRLRFRIPPKELEKLLPQQALMLQVAAEALDDAGVATDHHTHLSTGVYVGIELDMNTCNFHWRWQCERKLHDWESDGVLDGLATSNKEWLTGLKDASGPYLNADRTMGALGGIVASRLARWLGAGAGSFTVSCEQASALKAIEIAMRALRRREINLAVVGGVDLNGEPRALRAQEELQCGGVFGEGAGAVVLKRHSDAIRDGDQIYCLLRGMAQCSAGQNPPDSSAEQYQQCLKEALSDAGLDSVRLGLVELGGISSRFDTEMQVLKSGLGKSGMNSLVISSCREMLGDTGAADGMSSLLRMALCMHYRVLPTTPSLAKEDVQWDLGGYYCPKESHYWLRNRADGPRQALLCVNSLMGGMVQLIAEGVESYAQPPVEAVSTLLCVYGCDSDRLLQAIEECREQFVQASESSVAAIADRWHQHHVWEPGALTVSMVASDTSRFIALLREARSCVEGNMRPTSSELFYEPKPLVHQGGRLAFVFPGSGNHYNGMSRQLSVSAAAVLDQNDMRHQHLLDQFAGGRFWQNVPVSEHDHPTLLCSQIWASTFVYDIFRQMGVKGEAMIGYSLGETASLFASGCWHERDRMLARIRDTDLFTDQLGSGFVAIREHWGFDVSEPVNWRMAMVQAPVERVCEVLTQSFAKQMIYLLIINTNTECVVGGDEEILACFAAELGVVLHPINGATTVHCEVVRPVAEAYRNLHLQNTRSVAGMTHYSCHLGRSYQVNAESAADSILGMALETFDFRRLIETAYADGVRLFVETGPGAACTRMIDNILGEREHLACSASYSRVHEYTSLLQAAGRIAAHGVALNTHAWRQHHPVPDRCQHPQQVLTLAPGLLAWEVPERPIRRSKVPKPPFQPLDEMPPIPSALHDTQQAKNSWSTPVVQGMLAMLESRHQAHQAYLNLQSSIEESMHDALRLRLAACPAVERSFSDADLSPDIITPKVNSAVEAPILFDRPDCLRFAVGGIGEVLGTDFSDIDHFPTRVRLPDEPLMLVDRIMSIEGEAGSLGPARIITEHDIRPSAWYLDGNKIPTCIAVEAGQADLFLCGWLGVDRVTRGKAFYRLLDAEITFHDQLPGPGSCIRYDIRIIRFFTLGTTHLFQFEFDATVNGTLLLSMRNGSAGFFTQTELAAGQGIVRPPASSGLATKPAAHAAWLAPPLNPAEQYSEQQLDSLRDGDVTHCFGAGFDILPLHRAETLPGGRMRLVHRILDIQAPGPEACGQITGEADVHADDWFLTCHFVDDQVMPGTLMYECCLHTLRVYLLRMGWIGDQGQVVYQSVQGKRGKLKCRGQVIGSTRAVQYQIFVKETGFLEDGTPYAIADALMLADGHPIVEMQDMSLCLLGLTRQTLEVRWQQASGTPASTNRSPLFGQASILAYAEGRPSDAFGERYRIFDQERVLARLPRPPYLFLDQIDLIEHCQQWQPTAGGEIQSIHQITPQAWYFDANRQDAVPLAILMEIALQPCGWLAAYLGSALTSDVDLSFRNLDGQATLHRPMTRSSGCIQAQTRINKVSSSGGMTIQSFSVTLFDAVGALYICETVFGFFSKAALKQQVGIREAEWYAVEQVTTSPPEALPYPVHAPFPDSRFRMLDRVSVISQTGGRHGLGWVEGYADVDPDAWYFKAHFYQDPVIPGSLGIESMVQLLKVFALERWSHLKSTKDASTLFQAPVPGIEMRWTYRGQIIPQNNRVSVQIHLVKVDSLNAVLVADGYVVVDGRTIYSVENLSLILHGDR